MRYTNFYLPLGYTAILSRMLGVVWYGSITANHEHQAAWVCSLPDAVAGRGTTDDSPIIDQKSTTRLFQKYLVWVRG